MAKAAKPQKEIISKRKIEQILITSPKPGSTKSPYFELEKKYGVHLDFFPFIRVEGLSSKEFRQQRINLNDFTATIFVSRNSVEHFFRICEEMKMKISQDRKYFCASEAVALYLQKFIQYRKRKVFFSPDGSSEGLIEVMKKHKEDEKFFFPVSEHTKNDISPLLKQEGFDFVEAPLYRTVSNEVADILKNKYDLIVFFSPFSVETLMNQKKGFTTKDLLFGAFGNNTSNAVKASGLTLAVKAPGPNTPSMVSALEQFLGEQK